MSKNRTGALVLGLVFIVSGVARAQQQAPSSDTPSIKVGALIFADYTIQQQPKITDSDNNKVTLSAFQISRSYINVTGNISKTVSFRVTPDIARETGVGSSLNGSYTFRLKFAYAQWNLDDHLGAGSYLKFGQQQNPWIEFIDTVYRYRFQGQTFNDREGILPSADVGATFHYNLPGNYGDIHTGFFNGETYQHAEINDQKAFQIRGTIRPIPGHSIAQGLRVTGFYDHDAYVKNAERRRAIVGVTFEHQYLNAGFDYTATKDSCRFLSPSSCPSSATDANGHGWSAFVTPRSSLGWEGLLRFDRLEPNTAIAGKTKQRTIAGVAYWFPHQGNVASALLFDVDNAKYTKYPSTQAPTERKIAVHALVSF